MSELENLAKPLLIPLIDGDSVDLPGHSQVIIAAWMLKTFMVFDSVDQQYWRPDERATMSARRVGPALTGCLTAAAHYVGRFKAISFPRRQSATLLSGKDTGPPVFSGVLVVGQAILFLQADRTAEFVLPGRQLWLLPRPHFNRFSILGGPDSPSVHWPRGQSLDDAALDEFLGLEAAQGFSSALWP